MEADHARPVRLLEVAHHGIPDRGLELFCRVSLGEDRFPESAGRESTFGILLDDEQDLSSSGHTLTF